MPEIVVFEDGCQARLHLGLVDGLALALVAILLLATAAAVRAIRERRYGRHGRAFVERLDDVGHAAGDKIPAAFIVVWIVGSVKGKQKSANSGSRNVPAIQISMGKKEWKASSSSSHSPSIAICQQILLQCV